MLWSEVREPCEDCRYHHVLYNSVVFGNVYIEWKGWDTYPSYDCVIYRGEEPLFVNSGTLEGCKFQVWELVRGLVAEELERLTSGGKL